MAKTYLESLMAHNERPEVIARQHWFMLVRSVLLEVILIAVILAVVSFLVVLFPPAAFAYLLILIPLTILIRDVLDWWNRQYVITNRRVIQVVGTLNKRVTDSSLEKVNDVKMVQSFFGRIFDFGDLEILTASEAGIDKLSWLADPIRFKTSMLDAKERIDRS
ncbi:MAG TPA: PH domain-containing protein [Anaerolineales bacterium]|nr:PH domain-containing protein [Anaerolineales bacterium]